MENRPKSCNRVTITTSKYQPKSNRQLAARWLPQAPAVPAPSRRELFRPRLFARYRSIVRYRAFSIFQSTAWERYAPKPHKPKRGQKLKPRTRAKAKGQSRLVPPGGFSRGEQFERERVAPPLSRLLCLLSCRSKKVRPRWQALAEIRLNNRLKGFNRVSIPTSKYHPQQTTSSRRSGAIFPPAFSYPSHNKRGCPFGQPLDFILLPWRQQ